MPFHRMVPLPRSFAADAHGCIMVAGFNGPTEYKVVGAIFSAPVAGLRSDQTAIPPREVDWECSASRLALARARSAATALTRPRSQYSLLAITSA
jgi:hypothetical protein